MNVLSEENIDKKEVLYRTTLDLVSRHGFHGTSMSMISRESGIAIGTIYHYFKSKDELIIELLKYAKQSGIRASFGKDDKQLSYYERLNLLWKQMYQHMTSNPEMLSYITQFFSSPYSEQEGHDNICFQTEFGNFIQDAQKDGFVQSNIPHAIISSIFLGSVVNSSKHSIRNKQQLSEKEIGMLVDIIWNGIKNK